MEDIATLEQQHACLDVREHRIEARSYIYVYSSILDDLDDEVRIYYTIGVYKLYASIIFKSISSLIKSNNCIAYYYLAIHTYYQYSNNTI